MRRSPWIDAARGLCLALMMIAHLPRNTLKDWLFLPFGLVPVAEAFVFLAGVSSGIAYRRLLHERGPAALRVRARMRALEIYATHALIFALVWYAGRRVPALAASWQQLDHPMEPTGGALPRGLLLLYQPAMLDILPMYALFLLGAPRAIEAAAGGRARHLAMASAAMWGLAQLGRALGLSHALPILQAGFFDLFAWQLLFVAGILASRLDLDAVRPSLRAAALAAGVAAIAAFELARARWGDPLAWPLADRATLGPARLALFAGIAVVAAAVSRALPRALAAPAAFLGARSLPVYAASVVACYLCYLPWRAVDRVASGPVAGALVLALYLPALARWTRGRWTVPAPAACAAAVIVALLLRSRGIDRSWWFDEAFSLRLASLPWGALAAAAARDTHTPEYFALLKVWIALAGTSEVALRALSAVLGAAGVLFVYLFAASSGDARGRLAGVLAASLVATDALQVAWTREVRMYALVVALAAASSWLLLRALREGGPRWWALHGVSALALSLAHHYGAFTVAAQALFVALAVRPRPPRWALLSPAIVAAGWIPFAAATAAQYGAVSSGWFAPPLGAGRAAWIAATTFGLFPAWPTRESPWPFAAAAGLAAVFTFAWRAGEVRARYAVIAAAVPIALGVALSTLGPAGTLMGRYLLGAQVFLFAAVAWAIAAVPFEKLRTALAGAVLAFAAWSAALAFVEPAEAQPDLRACAAHLAANVGPRDLAVADMGVYLPLRAYVPDSPRWVVYLEPDAPVWKGAAALTERDRRAGPADLAKLSADRVFAVEVGPRQVPAPPGWVRRGMKVFQQALPLGWSPGDDRRALPVRVIEYQVRR